MKLKICGMKYPENITEIAQLLPDYMGFIFWEKSARYFNGVLPQIPSSIKKTGVFVNENILNINKKIQKHNLQAVQLHGKESKYFCLELKEKINNTVEIIKVFSVDQNFDFQVIKPFEKTCNYFLFDTKGKLPGGNGTTFNWEILKKYNSEKPFFLSGGIGINETESVKKILKLNLPIHCIDINSKFENAPGLKNKALLLEFIQKAFL